jgi:hypothetical protein
MYACYYVIRNKLVSYPDLAINIFKAGTALLPYVFHRDFLKTYRLIEGAYVLKLKVYK